MTEIPGVNSPMTALRLLCLCLVPGFAAIPAWGGSVEPSPRPLAAATQAFQAPPEPVDSDSEPVPVMEPDGPLTLADALALALLGNPELAMFAYDLRAAEARTIQAGRIPNPELDIRFWRLDDTRLDSPEGDVRRRVILSQVFELGGKRQRRVEVAGAERRLAGWDYEARRVEVATLVARQFVAVVGAQRRVEAQERFVEFFDEMRDTVSALVRSGSIPGVELHELRRRAGLAAIDRDRAVFELQSARFRLAATWGGARPRFTVAVGDLEQAVDVPDIDTVIELAQQSPAIARWDAELERGQAVLRLARSGRVPDLDYGVGLRWDEDLDRRDYVVDLEIDLPIFDRKKGEILATRHELARARAGRDAARAIAGGEIAEAYFLLAEARARRRTVEEEVLPAARASFDAQARAFEGLPGNLEALLDARRDLTRSEVDHVQALIDYHRTLALLEGLVGQSFTD